MDAMQQAMPDVKGGVVPYLAVDGAVKAAEFYGRAFGAQTAMVVPPDASGRTMHVHLYVNGSSIMMSDLYPEHCPEGGTSMGPAQGFNLMIIVPDADAAFQRAVDAGATAVMPPADMFWGARYAQVRDPFGVLWALNEPKAPAGA